MAIRFRCQHCDTLMSIATRKAGMMISCPSCHAEIQVPASDPASAPPVEDLGTAPAALVDDEPAPEQAESDVEEAAEEREFSAYLKHDPGSHLPDAPLEISAPPDRPPLLSDEDEFAVPMRRSTIDDEMDLTPMVDVVFQLLIFFMVTASFALHKTIESPTPDPDQKGAAQSIQTLDDLEGVAILVKIDGQNGITIDDDPLPEGNNLADALRDKMRKEQKSEVIVTADNAAWHRTVVKVIDAANEVGMQKIRLTTRAGTGD